MKLKTKSYKKCCRCGAVGQVAIDFGKLGKLWFDMICWAGLATCLQKDIALFNSPNGNFLGELKKSYDTEQWFKKNNK